MTNTAVAPAVHPRPGGRQAAAAAGLGERRLPRRRGEDRARRGAAGRHRRPARRLARARRRDRQRQRGHRSRTARLPGDRRRLRPEPARARPRAGDRGRARRRPARGRRGSAAVPGPLLRRGDLGVRVDVRARTTRRPPPSWCASPSPGGTIALASWTPDGFIGELFRTVAAHVPPPAGVRSPMLWGTEEHLESLFGTAISSLEVTERDFTFRFRSAEEFVEFFRTWYGPTLKAFAASTPTRRARRSSTTSSRSPAGTTGSGRRRDRDPVRVHRGGRDHLVTRPASRADGRPRAAVGGIARTRT